jgi:hypothetical protein
MLPALQLFCVFDIYNLAAHQLSTFVGAQCLRPGVFEKLAVPSGLSRLKCCQKIVEIVATVLIVKCDRVEKWFNHILDGR